MKRKLSTIFWICIIVLSLSACKDGNKTKENGTKELVSLDSTDVIVNEDGSFFIEGKINTLGTTLKIDGVTLTPSVDANSQFSAGVQIDNPVDSIVLVAAFYPNTQEITVNLDTTKYAASLQKIQEAEQLKQEQTDELNSLVGSTLIDAKTKLEELAFTVSYAYETDGFDCTAEVATAGEEWQSGWAITKVESINTENHTVKIYISTPETIAAKQESARALAALQEKLESGYAWQAAEAYGKAQYPYGFKLHYIMGKLAEGAQDENTWILKAECDVTNAFNATAKLTCEAKVTGTNDNPEVISFNVY